ncbi:MAG: AAA family ATPase [Segatella copri]
MFENVNNIIIKGGHFLQNTVLANVLDKRINLLFGRNGSGKSTIARAMSELADPTLVPELRTFEIIELDRPLSDENKKSIFVFNEDFIEKHVKVEDDELGPIVMLGDQVDIAEKMGHRDRYIDSLIHQ